jgi:hypothetical protein
MEWHVQYCHGGTDRLASYLSPEKAIEAACCLIDDGCEVFGIGTGPITDSIDKFQIARIYAMWTHPKRPFGIASR